MSSHTLSITYRNHKRTYTVRQYPKTKHSTELQWTTSNNAVTKCNDAISLFLQLRVWFNPRPAGVGGIFCPPPPTSRIFAITWEIRKISPPNFQYLIGHQFDTLSENFVKFGWNFLRKWRFSDVMSCDFELKMVVSYIDRRSMYTEANRKKWCQNKGNWILYKMAISDFQKFWILTPKIKKKQVFLGKGL